MNCKHCKHYSTRVEKYVLTYEPGVKQRNVGQCNNPLLVQGGGGCPENGLLATCDEGRGELEVGENFGCIHFKEKP